MPRQTERVKAIMGKCVAVNSTQKYAGQNSIFAEYCYDNDEYRDLLEPWFLQTMESFDTPTKRLKYAKECMLAMNSDDDNCPFILSDLSFEQFSDYLDRRTSRRGKNKGKEDSLGMATIEQAKSALRNLYRFSKYEMSDSMDVLLKQYLSGKKRDIAEKKKISGDYARVGKAKMDFKVYEKLCELFLKEEGEEFIFARCFLALEWNLMARSENIVHANVLHISWDNDSLVFRFVKTKNDQTGRNKDQRWHVYATPENPTTCPVLAMACYLFANPGILSSSSSFAADIDDNEAALGESMELGEDSMELEADGMDEDGSEDGVDTAPIDGHRRSTMHSGRLFPGGNQYDRFMDCLHRIIDKHRDAFYSLGITAGDLGSHSARKGACSYASAGSTVSPPIVSICLRAMWSMGQVKERYLQYEKAGDQYLGRVVSGLDVNSVAFAVSPPFFDADEEMRVQIDTLLKGYLVGGEHLPAGVYRIFYYCLASLCYHHEFLSSTLHRKSKLQASPFFSAMPQYALSSATIKFPWEKTASTPIFTGIPPHISLLAQVEQLKLELAKNRDEVLAGFKAELDDRHIGSQNHFDKEAICALLTEMHTDMINGFEKFGRNAANMVRECSGVDDVILQQMSGGAGDTEEQADSTITMRGQSGTHKFQVFFGKDGIISRVPTDFVFPEMTLCTLITFWFCGNPRKKIIPLKMLSAREIANVKERPKLTKMKAMMKAVQLGATQLGVWGGQSKWEVADSVRLFESVEHLFDYPAKNGKIRRCRQISWITVQNLYSDTFGKKFATQLKG